MQLRIPLFALAVVLPGCGLGDLRENIWPTGPGEPPRPCSEATAWDISGFGGDDVVPGDGASPPAVAMDVGESRQLTASPAWAYGTSYTGCDALVASVRWTSTSPAVAAFGPAGRSVWLTALRPGDTEIGGEITLTDGRSYHVSIDAFAQFQGQPVQRVRVFPAATAPGRRVVFSGTVSLTPNPRGLGTDARLPFDVSTPGTLDMVVDWRSTSNAVLGHVCPGTMPPGLGCVPVIDGAQSPKDKPKVGRARVAPGTYTLWITNLGPAEEVVTYEAGLVPD